MGTRTAKEDVWEFGFNSPCANGVAVLSKGKLESRVKNVSAIVAQFPLQIDRRFGFDTKLAVPCDGKAILDGLCQMCIQAFETLVRRAGAHLVVVLAEQPPGTIQRKKRECVEAACPEVRRQYAVIGQGMAV